MDQNDNTNVDDALQQAINEITNSSADQSNPFLDPVAGPADLSGAGEPVAPAEDAPSMTGPIEPAGPFAIPEPAVAPTQDLMPNGFNDFAATPAAEPTENTPVVTSAAPASSDDLKAVQDEALDELIPMLDELTDIDALEKDTLYRRAYESSRKPEVLVKALANAKQITDPKERAAALLYIVKAN